MGTECGTYEWKKKYLQSFGGETCSKETILQSRRGWDDNIHLNLKEIGMKNVNSIHSAQDKKYKLW